MDNQSISNLKEALEFSPENIPLRLHLADSLREMERLEEAESEYQEVIRRSNGEQGKHGLAQVYYAKGDYGTSNVILEELLEQDPDNVELRTLYVRALVKEGAMEQAIEVYQLLLELNPGFSDLELDSQLRTAVDAPETPNLEEGFNPFIQRPAINFGDVGGMDGVKKEIEMKIIHPLNHPDLYEAYGKKTGGGILLYGPPGCGKTYIARATAGQVNARFISIGLNDILDMWIGNSEKNLHGVFDVARDYAPCVLFFDEIDALGASRSDMRQSSGRHLINQFLQELDGVDADNEGVLVLGATNAPWHLDSAFRRPGRFDRIIFVPPPDETAREAIVRLKLNGKPLDKVDYEALARKTQDYSGADLEAMIDIAIEGKLEQSFTDGIPKPITTKDLIQASKKHRPSTQEWFSTAKNFALYANDGGLYDDILDYMKIKK